MDTFSSYKCTPNTAPVRLVGNSESHNNTRDSLWIMTKFRRYKTAGAYVAAAIFRLSIETVPINCHLWAISAKTSANSPVNCWSSVSSVGGSLQLRNRRPRWSTWPTKSCQNPSPIARSSHNNDMLSRAAQCRHTYKCADSTSSTRISTCCRGSILCRCFDVPIPSVSVSDTSCKNSDQWSASSLGHTYGQV